MLPFWQEPGRLRRQNGLGVAAGMLGALPARPGRAPRFLVAVVPVVAPAPAATTIAVTTAAATTIAAPASSISRLQASKAGHGQRTCQQPKDAAASGGTVGVGHLLRELLDIHFEELLLDCNGGPTPPDVSPHALLAGVRVRLRR